MLVVQAAGYGGGSGGGSLVYAYVQMRPPVDLLDEGWPSAYSRRALDPYYDLVAHMLDVAQIHPSPPDVRSPARRARSSTLSMDWDERTKRSFPLSDQAAASTCRVGRSIDGSALPGHPAGCSLGGSPSRGPPAPERT
jgi:hypothetical protein